MTDMLIGAVIGYVLALATMIMMWSLCVVAKNGDDDNGHKGTPD